jgi:cytidine deaminase
MSELLPHAFDVSDLSTGTTPSLPPRLTEFLGLGTVFVHPDVDEGRRVWTAYWERSGGDPEVRAGILDEAPTWPDSADAIEWGRKRTPQVVVVDADGKTWWAGEGEPPAEIGQRWTP